MATIYVHYIYFFIIFILLIGQGDGQWKKSSRDVLQRDIKLYKRMTEKIKQEFEEYYGEYSEEPINDYFLEEIDYVQRKIEKHITPKIERKGYKDISYPRVNFSEEDHSVKNPHTKEYTPNILLKNTNIVSIHEIDNGNVTWPKFEEILLAIGKQYDWKNDRWIKVKTKIKEKQKNTSNNVENNADHQKHNFRYRFVKLNRAKSKRKIIIAVTAVR